MGGLIYGYAMTDVLDPEITKEVARALAPEFWLAGDAESEIRRIAHFNPDAAVVSVIGTEVTVLLRDRDGFLIPIDTIRQSRTGMIQVAVYRARVAARAAIATRLGVTGQQVDDLVDWLDEPRHYRAVANLLDASCFVPDFHGLPFIHPGQLDIRAISPIFPKLIGAAPGGINLVTGDELAADDVAGLNLLRHGWHGCVLPRFNLLDTALAGNVKIARSTDPNREGVELVDVIATSRNAEVMAWFIQEHIGTAFFYRLAACLTAPLAEVTTLIGEVSGSGKGTIRDCLIKAFGASAVNWVYSKKGAGKDTQFTGAVDALTDSLLLFFEEIQEISPLGVELPHALCEASQTVHRKGKDPLLGVPRIGNGIFVGGAYPEVDFNSQPMKRRLAYLMELPDTIPALQPAVYHRLVNEADCIAYLMAWLIRAAGYLADSSRTPPPGIIPEGLRSDGRCQLSDDFVQQWQEDTPPDPVQVLRNAVQQTRNLDDFTSSKELEQALLDGDVERIPKGKAWAKLLRKAFPGCETAQKKIEGKAVRGYFGIKLIAPEDSDG